MTDTPLVLTRVQESVAFVTLNRSGRRNALVPELLDALTAALEGLPTDGLCAVVLEGAGATFSSGGDLGAFAARTGEELRLYAREVVGGLNRAVLALLRLPVPVVTRVQGFVTGGSAGFLFAADLVVMADDAYVAPYYVEVGFAPDGGWTVLLPELIGHARAGRIQYLNRPVTAGEAMELGLAHQIAPVDGLDAAVEAVLHGLRRKSPRSLRATKALLTPPERLARIEAGLAAELEAFVTAITAPETADRMAQFLARLRGAAA